MLLVPDARIRLDYRNAGAEIITSQLAGIAVDGDLIWTISDEGRTFECLELAADGYRLRKQFQVDHFVDEWPGMGETGGAAELDLEAIDIVDGKVWICSSHCRVRAKPSQNILSAVIKSHPSRELLARIDLKTEAEEGTRMLPRKGDGSIRAELAGDPYLAPFMELPSKENGFDIEGMLAVGKEVLLGLRGPLLDSYAVVAHVTLNSNFTAKSHRLSMVDLGGLAVRDLCRWEDDFLILAGPMDEVAGPFRLYRWKPLQSDTIQDAQMVGEWPASDEKPEGICRLMHNGSAGLIVVYDTPAPNRVVDNSYFADWFQLPKVV